MFNLQLNYGLNIFWNIFAAIFVCQTFSVTGSMTVQMPGMKLTRAVDLAKVAFYTKWFNQMISCLVAKYINLLSTIVQSIIEVMLTITSTVANKHSDLFRNFLIFSGLVSVDRGPPTYLIYCFVLKSLNTHNKGKENTIRCALFRAVLKAIQSSGQDKLRRQN